MELTNEGKEELKELFDSVEKMPTIMTSAYLKQEKVLASLGPYGRNVIVYWDQLIDQKYGAGTAAKTRESAARYVKLLTEYDIAQQKIFDLKVKEAASAKRAKKITKSIVGGVFLTAAVFGLFYFGTKLLLEYLPKKATA